MMDGCRGIIMGAGRGKYTLTHSNLRPTPLLGAGHSRKNPWCVFPNQYLLFNLGLSGDNIDWEQLNAAWDELGPLTMRVEWVRVYQDPTESSNSVSCDPPDFPTREYINRHHDAYTNPNLTVWGVEEHGYGEMWPRNRLYANGKGCRTPHLGMPGDPATPRLYPHATATPA